MQHHTSLRLAGTRVDLLARWEFYVQKYDLESECPSPLPYSVSLNQDGASIHAQKATQTDLQFSGGAIAFYFSFSFTSRWYFHWKISVFVCTGSFKRNHW